MVWKKDIKSDTRDAVGIHVPNSLDDLPAIHLDKLGALKTTENVDDWIKILTFYRVE